MHKKIHGGPKRKLRFYLNMLLTLHGEKSDIFICSQSGENHLIVFTVVMFNILLYVLYTSRNPAQSPSHFTVTFHRV